MALQGRLAVLVKPALLLLAIGISLLSVAGEGVVPVGTPAVAHTLLRREPGSTVAAGIRPHLTAGRHASRKTSPAKKNALAMTGRHASSMTPPANNALAASLYASAAKSELGQSLNATTSTDNMQSELRKVESLDPNSPDFDSQLDLLSEEFDLGMLADPGAATAASPNSTSKSTSEVNATATPRAEGVTAAATAQISDLTNLTAYDPIFDFDPYDQQYIGESGKDFAARIDKLGKEFGFDPKKPIDIPDDIKVQALGDEAALLSDSPDAINPFKAPDANVDPDVDDIDQEFGLGAYSKNAASADGSIAGARPLGDDSFGDADAAETSNLDTSIGSDASSASGGVQGSDSVAAASAAQDTTTSLGGSFDASTKSAAEIKDAAIDKAAEFTTAKIVEAYLKNHSNGVSSADPSMPTSDADLTKSALASAGSDATAPGSDTSADPAKANSGSSADASSAGSARSTSVSSSDSVAQAHVDDPDEHHEVAHEVESDRDRRKEEHINPDDPDPGDHPKSTEPEAIDEEQEERQKEREHEESGRHRTEHTSDDTLSAMDEMRRRDAETERQNQKDRRDDHHSDNRDSRADGIYKESDGHKRSGNARGRYEDRDADNRRDEEPGSHHDSTFDDRPSSHIQGHERKHPDSDHEDSSDEEESDGDRNKHHDTTFDDTASEEEPRHGSERDHRDAKFDSERSNHGHQRHEADDGEEGSDSKRREHTDSEEPAEKHTHRGKKSHDHFDGYEH